MKNISVLSISILFFVITSNLHSQLPERNINLIPQPKSIVINDGSFIIKPSTKIYYERNTEEIAGYLVQKLKPAIGYDFVIEEWNGSVKENSIILSLSDNNNDMGKEGYTLVVNSKNVMIEAAQLNGLFYAVQTIRQLLPTQIESGQRVYNIDWRTSLAFNRRSGVEN